MGTGDIIALVGLIVVIATLVFGSGKFIGTMNFWKGSVARVEKQVTDGAAKFTDAIDKVVAVVADQGDKLQKHDQVLFGSSPNDKYGLVASNTELRQVTLHKYGTLLTEHEARLHFLEKDFKESMDRLASAIELIARRP